MWGLNWVQDRKSSLTLNNPKSTKTVLISKLVGFGKPWGCCEGYHTKNTKSEGTCVSKGDEF